MSHFGLDGQYDYLFCGKKCKKRKKKKRSIKNERKTLKNEERKASIERSRVENQILASQFEVGKQASKSKAVQPLTTPVNYQAQQRGKVAPSTPPEKNLDWLLPSLLGGTILIAALAGTYYYLYKPAIPQLNPIAA